MKNEYDNEQFFAEYAKMSRSTDGLPAAGEWHQLKPLFPDLNGKRVLDLGCGYGWHSKYAEDMGASEVLGIDISHKMLEMAKTRNAGSHITYQLCGIEAYDYPEDTWDLVISNLALHYIEDLDSIFAKVHNTKKMEHLHIGQLMIITTLAKDIQTSLAVMSSNTTTHLHRY